MRLLQAAAVVLTTLMACNDGNQKTAATLANDSFTTISRKNADTLPPPFATESVNNPSKVIDWPAGKTPTAPAGFSVRQFADSLDHPRWIYVAKNGDIFVAESNTKLSGIKKLAAPLSKKARSTNAGESADRITLFRDNNRDGVAESRHIFAEGLNQPLGMLILKDHFYVANTDGLVRFPYMPGDTRLRSGGKVVLPLPAGGYNNHWTRNVISNAEGTKLYVSVGSGSNVAEHGLENEVRRACILEINPDGSGERVYGSGLRNPVGMDWAPGTTTLWTAVNERDGLGDELVPDYLTSVQPGGFYGWPFAYFGQNPDPRMKEQQQPGMVAKTIVPDVPLGAHTASLGLAFYKNKSFPEKYHGGAFIGQHGSWNRSTLSGYKVVFVPFAGGKAGTPEDFLKGFIADVEKKEVFGRPVGIAVLDDGSLLVADDVSNRIWRVQYDGRK